MLPGAGVLGAVSLTTPRLQQKQWKPLTHTLAPLMSCGTWVYR